MKEVAAKNTASLKLQGHVDVGDTISSLSISNNDTEFASINTVRQGTTAGDTTIATTGKLILNGQTGITIDCNNVTNQPVLHISNMGAGNTGIVLSRPGHNWSDYNWSVEWTMLGNVAILVPIEVLRL